MTTLTYSVELADEAPLRFPNRSLGTYRGFELHKEQQYQLFFLKAPAGKELPYPLACRFSQLSILQKAVDEWCAVNPTGALQDVPSHSQSAPIIKRPRPGHERILMKTIQIKHTIEEGKEVVHVPLKNSPAYVVMDLDGLDTLIEIGVPPPYKYKQRSVFGRNNGRDVPISRLLVDTKKGEHLRYFDTNPLNLRKNNLLKLPGMSKYRARDEVKMHYQRRHCEIEHVYEE
jgi:hypothetical protein